jgi:predicted nuclease of predicted toxin-antitoxin system
MQFKTDENVQPSAADLLRTGGHDVQTVWDESLRGTSDANLANVCRNEKRALITFDLDFANIRAFPPADYSGIIVLRLGSLAQLHVVQTLERLLPLLKTQPLAGLLWIVDEQSVRVHGET